MSQKVMTLDERLEKGLVYGVFQRGGTPDHPRLIEGSYYTYTDKVIGSTSWGPDSYDLVTFVLPYQFTEPLEDL